ncbi:hypothetical protein RintRC_3961 [Richelia intracellularis]|nr:hypothetical protein RintRC_3961 [Richelia intracellularis]
METGSSEAISAKLRPVLFYQYGGISENFTVSRFSARSYITLHHPPTFAFSGAGKGSAIIGTAQNINLSRASRITWKARTGVFVSPDILQRKYARLKSSVPQSPTTSNCTKLHALCAPFIGDRALIICPVKRGHRCRRAPSFCRSSFFALCAALIPIYRHSLVLHYICAEYLLTHIPHFKM